MSQLPVLISGLKCLIIRLAIFSNALWNYFLAAEQSSLLHAYEVIASCSRRPSIPFNKWMNPIQSPKRIRRKQRGIVYYCPIFMNNREKAIHLIGNILKVRRAVVSNVDWFFAIPSPKLGDV